MVASGLAWAAVTFSANAADLSAGMSLCWPESEGTQMACNWLISQRGFDIQLPSVSFHHFVLRKLRQARALLLCEVMWSAAKVERAW